MKYNVAIAGGGPAAAAAALQLARAGARTLIIERGDDRGDKPGESLAPAAKPILERLGVWEDLTRDGHLPSHANRSVWGSDRVEEMPFVFSPYGHGWHLDRRRFEQRLNERAVTAGATRITNTSVTAVDRTADRWRLTCRGAIEEVEATYLIDATGRSSRIARLLGARRIIEDPLIAVVSFLRADEPDPDSYTLVEATEHGWWYSATLPQNRLALMFITDPPAPTSPLTPPTHTAARIARHAYHPTAPPQIVDATSARLNTFAGNQWLAIGDAAVSYDPLSSHGLAAAMHGGILAAEAITTRDTRRYVTAMEAMWSAYVPMRREFYAAEGRWRDAPFWARRTGTELT
jgi:flavin-dependent dehydrogenase